MWRRDCVPTFPCLQHGTFRFNLKWNQESFFSILSPPWAVQVYSPTAESKFLFILQLYILYGKKSLVVTDVGRVAFQCLSPLTPRGDGHSGPQSYPCVVAPFVLPLYHRTLSLWNFYKVPLCSALCLGLFVPFPSDGYCCEGIYSLL